MGFTHAKYKQRHAAAGGDGWQDSYRNECLAIKAKADAEQALALAAAYAKAREEEEFFEAADTEGAAIAGIQ